MVECMTNGHRTMKYYNYGNNLGVIGSEVGHTDGDYTFLPGGHRNCWIRTIDLYDSREEAQQAPLAQFAYLGKARTIEEINNIRNS